MKVLNFGSLNVDHVYGVEHIVRPGETLATSSYNRFPGGKGANQSVALARAGAEVLHAGMVGSDSVWLRERLLSEGVGVEQVLVSDGPGGHAVIQVDRHGQNSIFLFGGANLAITEEHIASALDACVPGDFLLLQNEINVTEELIRAGVDAGLRVCFNPAPMTPDVCSFVLDGLALLIVNEHEGAALSGEGEPDGILEALRARYPDTAVCLTLGARGARYRDGEIDLQCPAYPGDPVDTTAAGDCFIGFLLAGLAADEPVENALKRASQAAALSVTRPGAMDAMPTLGEISRLPYPAEPRIACPLSPGGRSSR
ncbi:MAG: ribokinase [Lentisphaeria bacterium]|nr:ribokinase [Lentisphaeria bacterium]